MATHTHMYCMCAPGQRQTYILRIIHFVLDIPAAFGKKATSFQILKGDMFLIIDVQVRISILCCLTLQT